MNIELRYFTGTGNSLKVLACCQEIFAKNLHEVNLSVIKVGEIIDNIDLIGFSFPVYAFGIPRICRKYLSSLPPFKHQQKVFVIITAGAADESGFAVRECKKILQSKNCVLIYSVVIEMPINWIVSMNPPSKEEYTPIIEKGVALARSVASDILNGVERHHQYNVPKRYRRFKFFKDYLLFKYLGIQNLWRMFAVYDTCNGCGLCSMICPTHSIQMATCRPQWSSTCEQCMRCVNFCPYKAIYQSYSGDTLTRNRYHEPDFNPNKTTYS